MVSVATQESRNPMQTMARALHVPQAEIISSSLALPMKLMFPRDMPGRLAAMFAPSPPGGADESGSGAAESGSGAAGGVRIDFSIIGLGDIALPGLLIALARFLDCQRRGRDAGYFVHGFCGYVVGTRAGVRVPGPPVRRHVCDEGERI